MKNFADFEIEIPPGASGNIRTLCPKCSPDRKKASDKCLSVEVDKGTWICHHCDWRGCLKTGEDFKPMKFARPTYTVKPMPNEAAEYLKARGITQDIIEQEKIGFGKSFKDKGAIQFPYFKNGIVVNIKHRARDKTFRQEKDAEKCLYRFDEITKAKDTDLIITEGEIDALSFLVAGFNSVTSIPDGAPSPIAQSYTTKFDFLKSANLIFKKYTKIYLAMDNDDPGRVAEMELARRIGVEKCWRVNYPDGCKDANDVLVKHNEFAVVDLISNATPFPVDGLIYPKAAENELLHLYDQGIVRGHKTGWPVFNQYYTVKMGEMTIITGIPGHGKSNWLDALLVNLIKEHEMKFAVFSPENWPVERHLQNFVEKMSRRPFDKEGVELPRLKRKEVQGYLEIINNYIQFIMPEKDIVSVDAILERARIAIFRHGIKGLVIDPWNEVEHSIGNLREDQYISKELTKIRRFARMNGIHIWIVAHPKNQSKDESGQYKPPTMYDISGGAHWRNKADNGLCVYRPDYNIDKTTVYIQKIRFKEVGQLGEVEFAYCRDNGIYKDLTSEGYEVNYHNQELAN